MSETQVEDKFKEYKPKKVKISLEIPEDLKKELDEYTAKNCGGKRWVAIKELLEYRRVWERIRKLEAYIELLEEMDRDSEGKGFQSLEDAKKNKSFESIGEVDNGRRSI